jgi:hypothetical protein
MTPRGRRGVPTPALDAWRAELARGERTRTTFDPLFRAACEEMNALEAQPEQRAGYLARARRIIAAARRGRAA